ncbi:MAG: SDR family NAD(P)-dependent oxidoreductase [Phyllobacterium sp.]
MLEGKIAFITGAASGIGAATAKAFIDAGATVAVADINFAAARMFTESLGSENSFPLHVDVSDEPSVEAAMAEIQSRFGHLDIAFNNAGIGPSTLGIRGKSADKVSLEQWRKIMDVNLTGVWLCLKHEIKIMLKGSVITNTASIGGVLGLPGSAAYTAAKHGVIGLTRAAALENGPKGIRINAISPGYVTTPLTEDNFAANEERLLSRIPLRRFSTPDEIAEAVVWMSSVKASYLTGAVNMLDGGFSAG